MGFLVYIKLREGNIENSLIWYNRIEAKDLKKSVIKLQELFKNNANFILIYLDLIGKILLTNLIVI